MICLMVNVDKMYQSYESNDDTDTKPAPSALRRTAKLLRDVRVSGLGLGPEKPGPDRS